MSESTGQTSPKPDPAPAGGKNPAAVALGKLGGLKGGPARKIALSERRRKQIARAGAKAKWAKYNKIHKKQQQGG